MCKLVGQMGSLPGCFEGQSAVWTAFDAGIQPAKGPRFLGVSNRHQTKGPQPYRQTSRRLFSWLTEVLAENPFLAQGTTQSAPTRVPATQCQVLTLPNSPFSWLRSTLSPSPLNRSPCTGARCFDESQSQSIRGVQSATTGVHVQNATGPYALRWNL